MATPSNGHAPSLADEVEEARRYAEAIVRTIQTPLLVLNGDLRVESANPAFCRTFQVDPADTVGRKVYELGNGQWDIPRLRELLETVLPDKDDFNDYAIEHAFEAIGHRVMRLNGRRVDHLRLILLAVEDVTDRLKAEQELRRSEERLRALIQATNYAVYRMSPDWREMHELDGRGFLSDTGRPYDAWVSEVILPEDRDTVLAAIREAIRTRGMFQLEHRIRRADDTVGWSLSRAVPLLDEQGGLREWFGAACDITARKQAEAERELLLGELNHRMKNMFAIVRTLAMQAVGERSAADFQAVLLGRLDALIEAHSLALESERRRVDLGTLVDATLKPYRDGDNQHEIDSGGDRVELEARPTTSLCLVLHELATNAVKYGALSVPGGRIRLSWQRIVGTADRPWVRLEWKESGGPPVDLDGGTGFGTRLIRRIFDQELHGEADLQFHPEGVRLTAAFPLT